VVAKHRWAITVHGVSAAPLSAKMRLPFFAAEIIFFETARIAIEIILLAGLAWAFVGILNDAETLGSDGALDNWY
jgi:hypothetical protein